MPRPYRSGMRTRALSSAASAAASAAAAVGLGLLLLASALPAAAAVDKTISSSSLKALSSELGKGKHLTYEATYKTVSDGRTTVVTIAQAPPKSDFVTSNGDIVDTGTTTYFCSLTSGPETCLAEHGTNPFLSL